MPTAHIECIENAGRERRARRLVFSDGLGSRTTSASVLRVLSLEAGDEVDTAELESEIAALEPEHCRERALRILGYRDRSIAEMRVRLIDDGYPEPAVAEVVDDLVACGLLDDARFASAWVRARAAASFGPQRVRRELVGKGVDPDVIDVALSDVFVEDEADRARRLLRGPAPATRQERDRWVRRLIRKGFDLSTALKAVDTYDEGE